MLGCTWSLSAGPLWSEATGQHTATFYLHNTSDAACELRGYPEIVLLDAERRPLRFAYGHDGDQMVTSRTPRTVKVAAGARAFFMFNKYRCDVESTDVARFVRVRLPGSQRWLELRLRHDPTVDICPEAASRTIAVSPVVARPRDAAR